MRVLPILSAALSLGVAIPAATARAEKAPDKPGLELRVTPRMGFSPVEALFTLELEGGGEHEDYYCPELEWEWGDGGRSEQESDCDPFVAGESTIQRRYTARHLFKTSGSYRITVRLKRVGRTVAKTEANLTVRPGVGDQYQQGDPYQQ